MGVCMCVCVCVCLTYTLVGNIYDHLEINFLLE